MATSGPEDHGGASPWGPTSNAFLRGNWAPILREEEFRDLPVTGSIPPELIGKMLVRTGPNPRFRPLDMKYYHWFDGDGMLNAFYFEPEGVRYKNRWVETKKWTLENQAGTALFGGLRSPSSTTLQGWMKLRFGLVNLLWLGIRKLLGVGPTRNQFEQIATILNCANTSVVQQGDKLLALDEAGKPYQLTRELGTLGLYDYDGKLVGPSIAHPITDPFTGESFTMGYNALPPYFQYYRIAPSGAISQYEPIEVPFGVMMHSFGLSEHYVLFFHLPAVFDIRNVGTHEPFRWMPERGARLGVMPRHGTSADTRWFDIPACWLFHNMNVWEDGDCLVTDVARYPRIPLLDLPTANPSPPFNLEPHGALVRWRLDLKSGALDEQVLTAEPSEFPTMDDRFATRRQRHGWWIYLDKGNEDVGLWNTVMHYDFETGERDTFHVGDGCYTGEALFTPRHKDSAEGDGYLMNVVYDIRENKSRLMIFDARRVAAGPLAVVQLPRRIEYDFHGNIV
jgi:carotenoid cleavage dioxygenase-like enzyme